MLVSGFVKVSKGFETMSVELEKRLHWKNQRVPAISNEMFPISSTDQNEYDIEMLTAAYHNYKREYVKHLSFSPEEENLSIFSFQF